MEISETDKEGIYFVIIKGHFFFFLHKSIRCGYSVRRF